MKNKSYLKIKRDEDGRWVAYTIPRTRPQVVIIGLIFITYLICYMIYGNQAIASGAYAGDGRRDGFTRRNGIQINSFKDESRTRSMGEIAEITIVSDPYSIPDPCGLEAVECEGEIIKKNNQGSNQNIGRITEMAGYSIASYATNPNHERNVLAIYTSIHVTNANEADAFIKARFPKSPVTGGMVYRASEKYNVDPRLVMAIMQEDSGYGTQGLGARTMNPGNVANRDDGHTFTYPTWEDGVCGVARWLSKHKI